MPKLNLSAYLSIDTIEGVQQAASHIPGSSYSGIAALAISDWLDRQEAEKVMIRLEGETVVKEAGEPFPKMRGEHKRGRPSDEDSLTDRTTVRQVKLHVDIDLFVRFNNSVWWLSMHPSYAVDNALHTWLSAQNYLS